MTTGRIFPTMRQLVISTIVGLASHPRIQNPGIYRLGSKTEEKVQVWRAFGGYELIEPGLVCSVYPAYSTKTPKGALPPLTSKKSVVLSPYTLGSLPETGSLEEGIYTLVVELSFRDPSFGEVIKVGYDQMQSIYPDVPPLTPHGMNVMAHEGGQLNLATNDLEAYLPSTEGLYREYKTVNISVSPAEELLREYTELFRLALNDMPGLRPFSVRSANVIAIDYPTSAWSREATDLLFHIAYLVWEIKLFPPTHWKDIYFMPIHSVEANTPNESHDIVL